MALVLSLSEGDEFNIGYHRYRVTSVSLPTGCVVEELGGTTHPITPDTFLPIRHDITLREGLRKQQDVVKLMINAPKDQKIWRGICAHGKTVALLAPIPEEHLISGQAMCAQAGRVSYGSRAFEVFRKLDELCDGAPCQVLIYASWGSVVPPGPPKITWTATYLRTVEARPDGSPPKGIFRPKSTEDYPGDNKGHWAVYWEVTDLRLIATEEKILISTLRGKNSAKPYLKTFRPEGPTIIEAL